MVASGLRAPTAPGMDTPGVTADGDTPAIPHYDWTDDSAVRW